MRSCFVLLLALLSCVRAPPAQPTRAFLSSLPDGIPDVTHWQLVTGEFEIRTARGAYRFYVNPARPALYQLMRYRVELLTGTDPWNRARGSAERVAFVRRPEVREPIDCWEWRSADATPAWRRIAPGTTEYKRELSVLLSVIAVHRAARAAERAPN